MVLYTMHTTHKTSVSIKKTNRERLSQIKNRSAIINAALDLYHDKMQYMQQAEQKRMDESIQQWLDDIKNEDTINYDGVPGDKEHLSSFLTNLANS